MTPEPFSRVFVIGGERCSLVDDATVRERDLAEHAVTLRRATDGEHFRITAAEFAGDVREDPVLVQPAKRYRFRELLERVLEAGFDDEWIASIGRHVRDHRLLMLPGEAGS